MPRGCGRASDQRSPEPCSSSSPSCWPSHAASAATGGGITMVAAQAWRHRRSTRAWTSGGRGGRMPGGGGPVADFLLGVDVGGTFTDVLVVDGPAGRFRVVKVPTTAH